MVAQTYHDGGDHQSKTNDNTKQAKEWCAKEERQQGTNISTTPSTAGSPRRRPLPLQDPIHAVLRESSPACFSIFVQTVSKSGAEMRSCISRGSLPGYSRFSCADRSAQRVRGV